LLNFHPTTKGPQRACLFNLLKGWVNNDKACVYRGHFLVITLASVTDYLHALATLGDATKNRNVPISVMPPKVAKASSHMTVACGCRWS
jgi:hypothetical protein